MPWEAPSRATFAQLPVRLISQRLENGVKVTESVCQLLTESARVNAQVSHRVSALVRTHANSALNEIEDSKAKRLVEVLIKYTDNFARQNNIASLKLRECTQFSSDCKQRLKGWKQESFAEFVKATKQVAVAQEEGIKARTRLQNAKKDKEDKEDKEERANVEPQTAKEKLKLQRKIDTCAEHVWEAKIALRNTIFKREEIGEVLAVSSQELELERIPQMCQGFSEFIAVQRQSLEAQTAHLAQLQTALDAVHEHEDLQLFIDKHKHPAHQQTKALLLLDWSASEAGSSASGDYQPMGAEQAAIVTAHIDSYFSAATHWETPAAKGLGSDDELVALLADSAGARREYLHLLNDRRCIEQQIPTAEGFEVSGEFMSRWYCGGELTCALCRLCAKHFGAYFSTACLSWSRVMTKSVCR
jgi:hypothetical protein